MPVSKRASAADQQEAARLSKMVCFNVHLAMRTITAAHRPLLEPLGLTCPQYHVLATLWEYGDLTVGDILRELQLDYGTVTPLLKRLEARGLVKRVRNPDDERSVIVHLTEEGRALSVHAGEISQRICEIFDITPERAAATEAVLRAIVDGGRTD